MQTCFLSNITREKTLNQGLFLGTCAAIEGEYFVSMGFPVDCPYRVGFVALPIVYNIVYVVNILLVIGLVNI